MTVATLSNKAMRVAIIIVNYKTAELTLSCLRSIEPELSSSVTLHVIVVEGCSGEGARLRKSVQANGWDVWATVIDADRNGGFSYGNNIGIREAMSWSVPPDFFLLLNPDTEVRPLSIQALVDFLDRRADVGIAGSSFENPDGSEWPIAFRFPSVLSELERGLRLGFFSRIVRDRVVARDMGGREQQTDWVAGASMMIRREVLEGIGLLDEEYFLYYEEVDFCLRAKRADWLCWYVPSSRVMHISGQSTGVSSRDIKTKPMPSYWFESRSRYFVKNYGIWNARLADLAYGTGLAIHKARSWLSRKPDLDPPHLLRDFWLSSALWRGAELASKGSSKH